MRRIDLIYIRAVLALGLFAASAIPAITAQAQQSETQKLQQKQQQAAQPGLTQERMAELRNYFYLSDLNNDQSLTIGELKSLLYMDNDHTKYDRPALRQIIASVDYNYNSTMEESEMLIYMAYTKPSPGPVIDEETRFFNSYDEDGDGFIQLDELRQEMGAVDDSLTDEDISDLFEQNDFDRNQKLNKREFKILMQFND